MEQLQLIMLGTGEATVTRCYNTCFAIRDGEEYLLVDGGGGNGILAQLEKAEIPLRHIHTVFVTHAHSDHILGIIWIIRMAGQEMLRGSYEGSLIIYCHDEALQCLRTICGLVLMQKITALFDIRIRFREVRDGEVISWQKRELTFFDIHSVKMKQFGFRLRETAGQRPGSGACTVTCLGDEPYQDSCRGYVEKADWLLCEAFCLYSQREIYRPYEKSHSTVRDACELAERMRVRNLVLYHAEDDHMAERGRLYIQEGKQYFSGRLYVPDDLDKILL